MDRKLRNRVAAGLALAALLLAAVGALVIRGAREFVAGSRWVEHTHDVLAALEHAYATVKDVEADQRGYLLTGRVELEEQYLSDLPAARAAAAEVARLIADNPEQSARATRFRELVERRLEASRETFATFKSAGLDEARAVAARGRGIDLMNQIESLREELALHERELLEKRASASAADARLLEITTLVGLGVSLALFALVARRMIEEVDARQRAEDHLTSANLELGRSVRELAALGDQTRQLSRYAGMLQSCRSVAEALDVSREALTRLLPDCGGSLYLIRASQDFAEHVGGWGGPADERAALFPPQDCWALRRGQAFESDSLQGLRCPHLSSGSGTPACCICVPLVAHGEILGLLSVSRDHSPPTAQRDLLMAAAEQLSLALSNLRLQDSLRTQSIRDPLTGLFNRRYLEESLARELARCERAGKPLSVLMIDLDHFKRFNDTHGHDGGDALLTHAGRVLQENCRVEDIACRYGGEEFTLILPEVDSQRAAERAETIRSAIEKLQVQHRRERLTPVTASIGIATFPAVAQEADDLLRLADAALYRAKQEGRNRLVAA